MRILAFAPACPWPPDEGGRLRTMGLLRGLAKSHHVSLLTTLHKPGDREGVEHLRSLFPVVEAVPIRGGLPGKLLAMARSYLTFSPYLACVYRVDALAAKLREMAAGADAVHAVYPYGAQLIEGLSCLKVMDTQNVEADILAGNARRAKGTLRRLHHAAQSFLMRRFELAVARRMDAVLACSEADREFFARANPASVTIPNAVEGLKERDFPPGRDVVFTGLMSYLANSDAAGWFAREVWPAVRRAFPDARLFLVGKNPRPEVASLAGPDVVVTGTVEDVAPYFRRARVFVCPLRVGSGTRLKILEAFSWGVPVVSTALGVSGIEARDGEHILVADDPDGFARMVMDVLGDDSLARRLADAGRELVSSRYTWDAVVGTLNEKVYRS